MIFGTPLERTVEDISQKLDELKNQRKLVELDLEKRILILENTAVSLQKLLGNIKDFEAAKDTISQIDDLQNKLRDIEDTNLISRLETVQSDDRQVLLDEDVGEIKQKIALLSDAIEILSESKAKSAGQESGAKMNPKEIASLKADVSSMKDAITKLEAGATQLNKVESLEEAAAKNQSDIQSIQVGIKELTGTVREKIELLERGIKNQKQHPADIPESIARDISAMQKEIERIKGLEAQIVKQIESDAKKLQDLKSLQDERKDYTSLKNSMEIIQKNVSLLKKEMDLDRTMYPENIMRLEKELAGIRSAKNGSASIADVQKLAEDISIIIKEQRMLKEKIPKYEETIDSLIKNNDALKSGILETVTTVKQTLSESADLKKTVMSFEQNIADIKGVKDKLPLVAQAVDLISAEMSAQREGESKAIQDLNAKVLQLESGGKHQFGNVVEKMETDIRLLRKELSLLKESAPEKNVGSVILSREIDSMKKNIFEALKISESLASDGAELKAKIKALEKTSLRQDSSHSADVPDSIEKDVLLLKKEMDLDRAMYSETIMRLEKEISGIKSILKSASKPSDQAADIRSLPSGNRPENSVPQDKFSDFASELKKVNAKLKSISEENGELKSELSEFKVLAGSLMEANQQLAEGLNETRLEIDEMRQKQPIIID